MLERLIGFRTISPGGLQRMLNERPVTVIDVNSHQSWQEAHVPGAVNLDPADYSDEDLPKERDVTLVFYCSNRMCRKAPNAARRARKMGYANVTVMSAGIQGWRATGLPTEDKTP